jgi:hypothetical protein
VKRKVKVVKKVKAVRTKRTTKRTLKLQKGKISGVAMIAIAAAVLVIGGGAFFLSKNGSSSNPVGGLVRATLNSNCELKDPELCKFVNNWKTLGDYTMTSASSDKSGIKMETLFEISGDEKSHMLVKQDSKDMMESITIGNTTYTKDFTDNKWTKFTYEEGKENEVTKDIMEQTEFDDTKAIEDKTEYKSLGKESCGNLNCFKYQVITPGDSSTQYIWFDDKDYLLRKQSVTDQDGNTFEGTFSYDKISISEPSPIKEGTAESMYGGEMPKMSEGDKAEYEKMKKDVENQMQNYDSYDSPEASE